MCIYSEISVEPEYVKDISFSKTYHGFLAGETKGDKLNTAELQRYFDLETLRYLFRPKPVARTLNELRPGQLFSFENRLCKVALFLGVALAEAVRFLEVFEGKCRGFVHIRARHSLAR